MDIQLAGGPEIFSDFEISQLQIPADLREAMSGFEDIPAENHEEIIGVRLSTGRQYR